MRKLKRYIALCAFVAMAILTACQANPKEIITRKWRPVDASGDYVSEDVKRNILKAGNIMEFKANGVFVSYQEGERPESGTYTLSEDAKTIHIAANGDRVSEMKIRELTRRRLILESETMVLTLEPAK